jgi:hypothetical protein
VFSQVVEPGIGDFHFKKIPTHYAYRMAAGKFSEQMHSGSWPFVEQGGRNIHLVVEDRMHPTGPADFSASERRGPLLFRESEECGAAHG